MLKLTIPSPLREIVDPFLERYGIALYVKRDDLIHPAISGNKWRKLKYNLLEAKAQKKTTLLSFGGAFSNHIYALAAAGKEFGFRTIGVIRGKDASPDNATLSFAEKQGMILHFIDRAEYRQKEQSHFIKQLHDLYGEFYLIPEGGSNVLAVKGCAELVDEIATDFDYLCCACGTGATLAGLIAGLPKNKKALGFSVLKAEGYIEKQVQQLLGQSDKNFEIFDDYHFGGYAKLAPELLAFMQSFEEQTQIEIEPIYTGKLFYGIYDRIKKGYFKPGDRIVALHTGGLQGLGGMRHNQRYTKGLFS